MYQKTVFDNGLRIVTEKIPHCRTVAVGIWVDVGSRDEHDLNNGSSHFVEHMLFKGTKERSAGRIARELDVLGGVSNAFTSRENTCFYASVLDTHLPRLAALFGDMLGHSSFDPLEVAREQQVILQEINMVEDQPDDQIHDLFFPLLWGKHPLSKTVLGSREVVAAMDSQKLKEHLATWYVPERMVIAAAGNVDHAAFASLWQAEFSRSRPGGGGATARRQPVHRQPRRQVFGKSLEQIHGVLGTYGLAVDHPQRYALILLNIILGGNMSSRLFQEIREKRGLAYSIYSFIDSFVDCGMLGIYLGVDRNGLDAALPLVRHELDRLCRDNVTAKELRDAKEYANSGLFLAAENLESRMTRIARNELCFGRYLSFEEVLADLDRVTPDEIRELAATLFAGDLAAAILGPVADMDWRLLDNG